MIGCLFASPSHCSLIHHSLLSAILTRDPPGELELEQYTDSSRQSEVPLHKNVVSRTWLGIIWRSWQEPELLSALENVFAYYSYPAQANLHVGITHDRLEDQNVDPYITDRNVYHTLRSSPTGTRETHLGTLLYSRRQQLAKHYSSNLSGEEPPFRIRQSDSAAKDERVHQQNDFPWTVAKAMDQPTYSRQANPQFSIPIRRKGHGKNPMVHNNTRTPLQ